MKFGLQKIIEPSRFFIILINLLVAVFWAFSYRFYDFATPMVGVLGTWFESVLPTTSILAHVLSFFFIQINSLFISRMNAKYGIIRRRTFLPNIIYIVLVSCLLPIQGHYLVHFSVTILLFALVVAFDTHKMKSATENAYLAFFLTSVSAFVVYEWLVFIPILMLAFASLKSYSFRAFLASILGFLTPWILIYGFYFLANDVCFDVSPYFQNLTAFHFVDLSNLPNLIFFGVLFLLLIVSFLQMPLLARQDSVIQRKYQQLLRIVLFFLLLLVMVRSDAFFCVLSMLAVPYAFLFAYTSTLKKSLLNTILFYVFLGVTLLFPLFLIAERF